ncbi:MAG: hypothetical protein EOP07_02055 [Proteobacteria bacterium]|nr:MAG: hypothetical protein EOP07_02055 [Pseudomonadota bacterium]
MNLPCKLAMLYSCYTFPEMPDRSFLPEPHKVLGAGDILATIRGEDVKEREVKLLESLRAGDWPAKLQHFKAIQVDALDHKLIYWVAPDYLAIGNDADSVLLPLSWTSVKVLAKEWQMLLPTAKMVDQIYQQADRLHWPHAYPPSEEMRSTEYFVNHNGWILEKSAIEFKDNPLIAGHKKDLVVSPKLLEKPTKLAIYGWHNLGNGAAIQPQSLWHGQFYVDYSHGIRLVAPLAELDGKPIALSKVLKDPRLAPLLSFEGAFDICAVLGYDCDPG